MEKIRRIVTLFANVNGISAANVIIWKAREEPFMDNNGRGIRAIKKYTNGTVFSRGYHCPG
jgi:hypothetical protein